MDPAISGIISGLIAAFLQSLSYVFSKQFIQKSGSPFQLAVYSQITMGLCGFLSLLPVLGHTSYPFTWQTFCPLAVTIVFFAVGQLSFFQTLKHLEASRLSSLLGLKIILLSFLSILVFKETVSGRQWIAILLCASAAVGMNFAGTHITWKAAFWLFLTLFGYSFSDLGAAGMVHAVQGTSPLFQSIAAAAITYITLGLCSTALLPFTGSRTQRSAAWNRKLFLAAMPFGLAWFFAMLFLYFCFGTAGVVFGNILQATRGIVSVLLGLAAVRLGFDDLEPKTARSAWIRRFVMACLMIAAVALYRS